VYRGYPGAKVRLEERGLPIGCAGSFVRRVLVGRGGRG